MRATTSGRVNELKPMTLPKLAFMAGFDEEECDALRYAAQYARKTDKYVAFMVRTLQRDLNHYRVLNLIVADEALAGGDETFHLAVEERNAWVGMLERKISGFIVYMAMYEA